MLEWINWLWIFSLMLLWFGGCLYLLYPVPGWRRERPCAEPEDPAVRG